MVEISKRDEICRANRNGNSIDDLPEIAESGLVLYEIKTKLNQCRKCDDYVSHLGNDYCLLKDYQEMAKRL